jgi:hypothetical protein
MFNISFPNKTQLKIKNIFFIFLDRTRFNAFLTLNRIGPAGTVELFMEETHEHWSMLHCSLKKTHEPPFMSFSAQEVANCCFLQSCGRATINRKSHQ